MKEAPKHHAETPGLEGHSRSAPAPPRASCSRDAERLAGPQIASQRCPTGSALCQEGPP